MGRTPWRCRVSDSHALSGAYAVDALDDRERIEFELHLTGCPACRAELQSFRATAALLTDTTVTRPPGRLRARVLRHSTTVRPLARTLLAVAEHEGGLRRRRVMVLLAAAAAVVGMSTGIAIHIGQHDDPQDRFSAIAQADDARTVTTRVGRGATISLVFSKKRDAAFIQTVRMAAAPAGRQYVVWLEHGSMSTPVGVIPESADSKVLLSGDVTTADGAAVSIEAEGTEPSEQSKDVVATFSIDP
jgi:hypothetical protein